RTRTPMRCPVCHGELRKVVVRDIGGLAPHTTWQIHAGECPEHGWFQAEVVRRPPREIFAVTRPFGAARRMVVNGHEYYAFTTVWSSLSGEEKRQKTDPLEEKYWVALPLADAPDA
ncbi:MAG TPA: hypothetical protein VNZ58_12045, partial [Thermomicrobiales bacterium]|nr:hypothetical protein [Thermomicrobiales bacterium]